MIKVTGLEKVSEIAKAEASIKKHLANARKLKIKELTDQGIDKALAAVMVDVMTEYKVI